MLLFVDLERLMVPGGFKASLNALGRLPFLASTFLLQAIVFGTLHSSFCAVTSV